MLLVSLSAIFAPLLIFLTLSFQVLALEGDVSAFKAYSRSFEMVKNNFISTILMIVLCYISTYWFLPELLTWVCEKVSLTTFAVTRFEIFATLLPLDTINGYLTFINTNTNATELGMMMFSAMITFLITGFTLPFRCCCFTELYKMYDSEKIKEFSKSTDEIVKRATGKKGKN